MSKSEVRNFEKYNAHEKKHGAHISNVFLKILPLAALAVFLGRNVSAGVTEGMKDLRLGANATKMGEQVVAGGDLKVRRNLLSLLDDKLKLGIGLGDDQKGAKNKGNDTMGRIVDTNPFFSTYVSWTAISKWGVIVTAEPFVSKGTRYEIYSDSTGRTTWDTDTPARGGVSWSLDVTPHFTMTATNDKYGSSYGATLTKLPLGYSEGTANWSASSTHFTGQQMNTDLNTTNWSVGADLLGGKDSKFALPVGYQNSWRSWSGSLGTSSPWSMTQTYGGPYLGFRFGKLTLTGAYLSGHGGVNSDDKIRGTSVSTTYAGESFRFSAGTDISVTAANNLPMGGFAKVSWTFGPSSGLSSDEAEDAELTGAGAEEGSAAGSELPR